MNSEGWVRALVVDGSGNLYAGGQFTTAGGVAANRIAKWNGSSWSALGTGMDGTVYALALDPAGNLIAGGAFPKAGGLTTNYIAKWNGSNWSALGSGMNSGVLALAVDGSGNVYAGGNFTSAGGVGANRVAKWNGITWSALGGGADNTVWALAADGGGNLYAAGDFTTAGAASATRIAKWNGSSWAALGSGLAGTYQPSVRALCAAGAGNIYAGGIFVSAGGKFSGYIAQWCEPAPVAISSVSPASGPRSGGLRVTVGGSGFATSGTVRVTFGGIEATAVEPVSSTQLACATPAHALGTVDVQVTNPDGWQGTGIGAYTYVGAPQFTTPPSANPSPGVVNRNIAFTCGVSGAAPVTVEWTFGDGGTATGASANHICRRAKVYPVSAKATDTYGQFTEAQVTPALIIRSTFGHFNADADTDVLWWDDANGNVFAWEMSGVTKLAQVSAGDEDHLLWAVVGTGDFNMDGKSDRVLRNQNAGVFVRFMDGATPGATLYRLGGAPLALYEVAGCADLNSDGATDVLFRRKTDGVVYAWLVNGGASPRVSGIARLGWASYAGWELISGAGDFNGDGGTDLVWREKAGSLRACAWLMNEVSVVSMQRIGSAAANWSLCAAGDYTADGRCDLLWRDASAGENLLWRMNGLAVEGTQYLEPKAGTNWRIVGPR
jgi:hypothetical protein